MECRAGADFAGQEAKQGLYVVLSYIKRRGEERMMGGERRMRGGEGRMRGGEGRMRGGEGRMRGREGREGEGREMFTKL